MYSKRPFIVGFHGCDKTVRDKIVSHQTEMMPSTNTYDWLGSGFYFWENNFERAFEFAQDQKKRGKVDEPAVLGAYLDLGNCFDLLESKNLLSLKNTYGELKKSFDLTGQTLPLNKTGQSSSDYLLRPLDRAVIEAHMSHSFPLYDSVRGVFWEGDDLYPGAGMKEKNHIQISIRNINCIKCFFIPRSKK